jgi:hypothetical protein
MRNAHKIFVKKPEDKRSLRIVPDERITLKWVLKKQDMRVRTQFIRLRRGTSGGLM